jgi:hypothetical protein
MAMVHRKGSSIDKDTGCGLEHGAHGVCMQVHRPPTVTVTGRMEECYSVDVGKRYWVVKKDSVRTLLRATVCISESLTVETMIDRKKRMTMLGTGSYSFFIVLNLVVYFLAFWWIVVGLKNIYYLSCYDHVGKLIWAV